MFAVVKLHSLFRRQQKFQVARDGFDRRIILDEKPNSSGRIERVDACRMINRVVAFRLAVSVRVPAARMRRSLQRCWRQTWPQQRILEIT